jgi:hypothetical protein
MVRTWRAYPIVWFSGIPTQRVLYLEEGRSPAARPYRRRMSSNLVPHFVLRLCLIFPAILSLGFALP